MAREKKPVELHFAEDEDLEKVRHWWKTNGAAVVTGVVLGLGAIVGFNVWQGYTENQAEEGSDRFQQMMQLAASGNVADTSAAAKQLIAENENTPYAAHAAFLLAKQAMEEGRHDEARGRLEWVKQNAKDDSMRHVARLRLASVLVDSGDLAAALEELNVEAPPSFETHYHEKRGDILREQGDLDGARSAYESALKAASADRVYTELLSAKLNETKRGSEQ